ncbi:MAG: hypothetical protein QOF18_2997, partial [Frankiaceae bacterium]|nr:hypothetical protein [Frankiaceae bacterium]
MSRRTTTSDTAATSTDTTELFLALGAVVKR